MSNDKHDNDWEFEGIFDHLTPDDFAERLSKTYTRRRKDTSATLDEFLDACLDSIYYASAQLKNGEHETLALLVDVDDQVHFFEPQADEKLGDYIERLTREARKLSARRLFLVRPTQVGHVMADEVRDVTDQSRLSQNATKLKPGILFYAAETQPARQRRLGYIPLGQDGLGEPFTGDSEQPSEIFDGILGL